MLGLFRSSLKCIRTVENVKSFHAGGLSQGFNEFYDVKIPGEPLTTGRAWSLADVRRKSFDDLHRLWFILYKERNLILTEKNKMRRTMQPITATDEHRYTKVKRSMAAIKHALSERAKINNLIKAEELKHLPPVIEPL